MEISDSFSEFEDQGSSNDEKDKNDSLELRKKNISDQIYKSYENN